MAILLDPTTPPRVIAAHLGGCPPCAALLAYGRQHADLVALAAWRRQLAAHVEADYERRDFERAVVRRIVTASTHGASIIEMLVSLGIVAVLAVNGAQPSMQTIAHVRPARGVE